MDYIGFPGASQAEAGRVDPCQKDVDKEMTGV
jgi:hypothetical protein